LLISVSFLFKTGRSRSTTTQKHTTHNISHTTPYTPNRLETKEAEQEERKRTEERRTTGEGTTTETTPTPNPRGEERRRGVCTQQQQGDTESIV
jgi:hypothetical protein